jgi:hypothetical protein
VSRKVDVEHRSAKTPETRQEVASAMSKIGFDCQVSSPDPTSDLGEQVDCSNAQDIDFNSAFLPSDAPTSEMTQEVNAGCSDDVDNGQVFQAGRFGGAIGYATSTGSLGSKSNAPQVVVDQVAKALHVQFRDC